MLGDWVENKSIIPTISEVLDTLNAVLEQPSEFDFTYGEALNIAIEELNMDLEMLGIVEFAKLAGM